MQFNDTTTNQGICQQIDFHCDSTPVSYPLSAKTREINTAMQTLVGLIINADGTWQFDDPNHTDYPIGTGTLISGQSSYTFSSSFLDIENIKILLVNGRWKILKPIDQSQTDIPLEDYLEVNGLPEYYDKNGRTIKLYPAPLATSVTLENGLKVQFKRTSYLFVATDTDREPGIKSTHHHLISKMASVPYCAKFKKDRVPLLLSQIKDGIKEMLKDYSSQEKDKRKGMTMKQINFR